MSSGLSTTAPADIPASSSVSGHSEKSTPQTMSKTTPPTLSPIMSPQIALNSHPPSAPMRRLPGGPPLSINTKPQPSGTEQPLSASGTIGKKIGHGNDNDGSEICLSPSWSDYRGTKRKKEKKRLGREKKELEKRQKADSEQQRAEYLASKRLSKKPPAAMDTQKMPLALRRNSGISFTGISFLSTPRSSSPDNSRRSSRDEGSSWRLSIGSIGKRRSLSTPSTSTELPPESRDKTSAAVSPENIPQVQPESQGSDSTVVSVVKPLLIQPHRDGSSYVHKQRMHQQQLSIAGYQVELAIQDANERLIRDDPPSKTLPTPSREFTVGVLKGDVPVSTLNFDPVNGEEPARQTSVTPVDGEGPARKPPAKPFDLEEPVRRTSVKRPHSTPLLQKIDPPPVLPSLDFLPQLKHQPLIKPKRTSHIIATNFPTTPDNLSFPASTKFSLPSMTSFPASSQFPLPSTTFLKLPQDSHIPPSNSAPDLKFLPRSPLRAATDTSLLRPVANPAHRRSMALLNFGKDGIAQGLDPRPVAKLFVICCRCKYWHDLPSNLYELMSSSKKLSRRESDDVGGSPGAGSVGGKAKEATLDTMVQCPWCQHYMTTYCCEGYTAVVYLHERHH